MNRVWSDKKFARRGEEHSQWKGGISKDRHGYSKRNINLVEEEFQSMCDCSGWILEHRYVMAKHLGRCLTSSEIVHHKDGDRTNNSIDNLELCTRASHMVEHNVKDRLAAYRIPKKKLLCVETGQKFVGYKQAEIALGISRHSIMRSLKTGAARCGYTFVIGE